MYPSIHVSKISMISKYPLIQLSKKNQYPRYPSIRISEKSGIRPSLILDKKKSNSQIHITVLKYFNKILNFTCEITSHFFFIDKKEG